MSSAWFPEEVANVKREADKDPLKKQLGDVAKRKGNSFYGKMIEYLGRHERTRFTREERSVDMALRSNTKRLRHTGNLFRNNLQLKDLC